jgi:hypothetical protein
VLVRGPSVWLGSFLLGFFSSFSGKFLASFCVFSLPHVCAVGIVKGCDGMCVCV